MTQAELFWGGPHAFAEMVGEGALVAEAVGEGDGGDIVLREEQGFGGLLDADAQGEFVGGDAEGFLDLAVERSFGNGEMPGEFGWGNGAVSGRSEMLHGSGGFGGGLHGGASGVAARHAHESDDCAVVAAQRDFSGDAPVEGAGFVEPNFQAVHQGLSRLEDNGIVGSVGICKVAWKNIVIGAANEVRFPLQAEAAQDGGAGGDHAPGNVFHKEIHLGKMLEDAAEGLWVSHVGEELALEAVMAHGEITIVFGGMTQAFSHRVFYVGMSCPCSGKIESSSKCTVVYL